MPQRVAALRAVAVLAWLACAALLLEGGPRLLLLDERLMYPLLYFQAVAPELHEPSDQERLYALKPGAVALTRHAFRVNELGFRDPPRSAAKPAGTVRVVFLGGSTTFGASVEDDETFTLQLERALNRRFRGRFEVWNAGVMAYVLRQEIQLAKEIVDRYSPDLLVFQHHNRGRRPFLWGQDAGPYLRRDPSLYEENVPYMPSRARWSLWLLRRSAFWRTLMLAINRLSERPPNNELFNGEERNIELFLRFYDAYHARVPIGFMPSLEGAYTPAPAGFGRGVPIVALAAKGRMPRRPCRDYFDVHPTACGYAWYAQSLAVELERLWPRLFVRAPGWTPSARDREERAGSCACGPDPAAREQAEAALLRAASY